MDRPFGSYYPVYHARTTSPSQPRKVVSIPIHYVGSNKSESESALRIQKAFRVFRVRKNLKKILAIKREVDKIERSLLNGETMEVIKIDTRERLMITESLTGLLIKLDSISGINDGIRDCRKAVIKQVIMLQNLIDDADESNEKVESEVDNLIVNDSSTMQIEDREKIEPENWECIRDQKSDFVESTSEKVESKVDNLIVNDSSTIRIEDREKIEPENWECVGDQTSDFVKSTPEKVESEVDNLIVNDSSTIQIEDREKIEPENLQCVGDQKSDFVESTPEKAESEVDNLIVNDSSTTQIEDREKIEPENLQCVGDQKSDFVESTPEKVESEVDNLIVNDSSITQIEDREKIEPENWECLGDQKSDFVDVSVEDVRIEKNDDKNSTKRSNDDWFVVRDGEEKKRSEKLMEKMVEDNQRLMALMEDLCERNAIQAKMISSLSQRVEQLEKAMGDRLKKKKKKNAAPVLSKRFDC